MEVTNRFKGLDLIDRVPDELWAEVCNIVQDAVAGKGLLLPRGGNHVVFLELRRDSRVTTGNS